MWTLTIGKTLGQLPRCLFLISSLEFGDIRMKKTEDHRILPWETAGWRNFSFWFHLLVLLVLMLVAIGVILGLEMFFGRALIHLLFHSALTMTDTLKT